MDSGAEVLALDDGDGIGIAACTPALAMLVGSGLVFWLRIPERVQACTQNFSAGLLISAVAGELFPLMTRPDLASPGIVRVSAWSSSFSILCGFTIGLLFMFGLEHFTEGDDKADELLACESSGPFMRRETSSHLAAPLLIGEQAERAMEAFTKEAQSMRDDVAKLEGGISEHSREFIDEMVHGLEYRVDRAKRLLTEQEPLDERNLDRIRFHLTELGENCESLLSQSSVQGAQAALKHMQLTLAHIHGHAERTKFRRWKAQPKPNLEEKLSEQLPWTLTFAVLVDASVDGLLIGLAFSASQSAGWCMSIATCIEMGFLGLSFSASVQNITRSLLLHSIIVMLPPVVLATSGFLGHGLGSLLTESPGLFIGFVAFSIVALLFLVTQELLSEAREVGGDSVFINVMFFIGLLGGILLEQVLG